MTHAHYDAIIFDFDGVLVDSVDVKTRAFAELYKSYGESVVAKVVAYHLAHGGVSRYEKFRHFHQQFLGTKLSSTEESELGRRFSQLVEDAVVASPPVPGAEEFLQKFSDLIPLYVASGTPDDELLRIVDRRGMAGSFRGVYGSPRKKGEILNSIAKQGGYQPSRVLMVGDAMTDLEGADAAGTSFLGRVPPGTASPFPSSVVTVADLCHPEDWL